METDIKLDDLLRQDWRALEPSERCACFKALISSLKNDFVKLLRSEPDQNELPRGVLRRTADFCILIDLSRLAGPQFAENGFQTRHHEGFDIFIDFCRRLQIFSVHEDCQNKRVHICFYQEAFCDPRFRDFTQMLIFYSKMTKPHLRICAPQNNEQLLSTREILYLQWAAEGKSERETSEILNISDEDIQRDVVVLLNKLNANNKVHAVAQATRMNLI